MWDKLKTALVLFVIASLSGLIIFAVNEATYEQIAINKDAKETGYYKEIFGLAEAYEIHTIKTDLTDGLDQEIIVSDTSDIVIGYIYKATVKNNYGEVTVMVGILVDGTISNVVISDTSNTPTYVNRIKTKYIGHFADQDVDSIIYDTKTGATYTYTAVATVVDNASAYYLESRGE